MHVSGEGRIELDGTRDGTQRVDEGAYQRVSLYRFEASNPVEELGSPAGEYRLARVIVVTYNGKQMELSGIPEERCKVVLDEPTSPPEYLRITWPDELRH